MHPRAPGPPSQASPVGHGAAPSVGELDPRERTFIFIGGLHRSGTSLLFQCLREHPAISGFNSTGSPEDEGQHLQTIYPPALAHGGPGRFGFDPSAHLTEESPLASDVNGRRLYEQWRPYWDTSRRLLLEKSPPNLIRARFLQALFPRSSFIMLTRHPIAVAYATRKWSKTPLYSLLRHWLVCHELMEEDRKRLKRVLVIRYEDFVREPNAHLSRIFAFLGVEPRATTLDVAPDINGKYFSRWLARRNSPLTRFYMSFLERRFEQQIARFGYSLRDLDR